MTEISVSREALEESFDRVREEIDTLDTHLGQVPDAPDGGTATEIIAFAMAAAKESAETAVDWYRALLAIAIDVLDDFAAHEDSAVMELVELKDAVEGDG